jgi:hypothetical protein
MYTSTPWIGCELPAPAPCRSKARLCQRLTPKPRPAANPEALLQRLVLLSILDRGPDEQREDDEDGRNRDDREDDLLTRVHTVSVPAQVISNARLGS